MLHLSPRLPPPHSHIRVCLSPPPLPHFHWLTAIVYLFHPYHCKGGKKRKGFPIESWGNNRGSTTVMSLPSSHAPIASSAIGYVSESSYGSRTFKMAVSIALIVLVQQEEEKGIIKPLRRYRCPQMALCPPL